MDALDLSSLLISRYLFPAADTWDTADPSARWNPVKMAVGIAAGWAIQRSHYDRAQAPQKLEPPALADALVHCLSAWAVAEDLRTNSAIRDLIVNGGTTGKGGFRGRLAAELVRLGF